MEFLALTDDHFVRVNDAMETCCPGVYAADDLTTSSQGALTAAAAGLHAAYSLIDGLTIGCEDPF